MSGNNDFWLRKIAAFLHDPPDKAFWHEFRELEALRFWFWITESENPPFYFSRLRVYRQNQTGSLSGLEQCFTRRWNEFLEALLDEQNPFGVGNIHGICGVSEKRFLSRDQKGIKNHFRRQFHFIASSQIRYHLFGFESKGGDIKQISLTHPLDKSSQFDVLKLIKELDIDNEKDNDIKIKIRKDIRDKIKTFADIKEPFKKFLALWRKRYWISSITPADTRIPDHPVIDLETIQSAIAATLQNNHKVYASFLILEFGPVQSFIANARKTRDLWFSSWLISYLAWYAMKPIAEKLGPDNIVYPDLYKQPLVDMWLINQGLDLSELKLEMVTLPNIFLAIVPEGREQEFAKLAEESLEDVWKKLRKEILELRDKKNSPPLKKILGSGAVDEFKHQTNSFPFDIYWLGLKWGHDPEKAIEDYKKFIEPNKCWEFERLWSEIKTKVKNPNIGDTYALLVEMIQTGLKALKYRGKPKVTNEPGHKCSLCGERTVLTDGNPNDFRGIKTFWKRIADAFPGHIKENEYLCAICLVKRLAPKVFIEKYKIDYHYPSTGSIAIAPFLSKALNAEELGLPKIQWEKIANKIEHYKKEKCRNDFLEKYILHGRSVPKIREKFKDDLEFLKQFEPEWLYPETPEREVIEPERHKGEQKFTPLAQELGETIQAALKDFAEKVSMPKYYAAVYLDGDDLGKWLRGKFAPKIEEIFHPDFVKTLYKNEETKREFELIKDKERPVTPAIHRAISSALRDFALEVVPYVVEENLGVVVYSGGDDTLFLMPLENLFKTLVALRMLYSGEKFVLKMEGRKFESDKGLIKIYDKNDNLIEIIRVMGTKATLSAGVAIAHYLDPLDITLSKAKAALKEAKNNGRNRAGFRLIVHSGNERKAIVPWNFVESMERFREAITGGFSPRFIRILFRERNIYENLEEAFDAEFLKFGKRGQSGYEKLLCELLSARKHNKLSPKEFLNTLLIADFVVRGEGGK